MSRVETQRLTGDGETVQDVECESVGLGDSRVTGSTH